MNERIQLLEQAMAEPMDEVEGQSKMRARWSQGYFTGKTVERQKIVALLLEDLKNYHAGDLKAESLYKEIINLIESRNKKK